MCSDLTVEAMRFRLCCAPAAWNYRIVVRHTPSVSLAPGIFTAVLLACPAWLVAQTRCDPPPPLTEAAASNPTAEVYNALGGLFAGSGHGECASDAFRKSIAMDDDYWEPRFNLGLLLGLLLE